MTNYNCPVIQEKEIIAVKESLFHKSQVTRNYASYLAYIRAIARPSALHIHVACNKFRLSKFYYPKITRKINCIFKITVCFLITWPCDNRKEKNNTWAFMLRISNISWISYSIALVTFGIVLNFVILYLHHVCLVCTCAIICLFLLLYFFY